MDLQTTRLQLLNQSVVASKIGNFSLKNGLSLVLELINDAAIKGYTFSQILHIAVPVTNVNDWELWFFLSLNVLLVDKVGVLSVKNVAKLLFIPDDGS